MNLYNVVPTLPFLPQLAEGMVQRYASDDLAQALILLPTNESCQWLKTYSDFGCRTIALGDVHTLYKIYGRGLLKPIPPLYRKFLLQKWLIEEAGIVNPSLSLIHSLTDVLDDFYVSQQPLQRLLTIKVGEWADHWRLTLGRLQNLVRYWPDLLAEEGYGETILIQQALFNRLCQTWQETPPDHPVVIAGTRGSRPATRQLIKTIANFPQGAVILPPYDPSMVQEDALPMTHPVWAIQNLITTLGKQEQDIPLWHCEDEEKTSFSTLALNEIMRPAETTDRWHQLHISDKKKAPPWSLITCPNQQREAEIILKLVQDHQKAERVAIVTADLQLSEAILSLAQVQKIPIHLSQITHLGQSQVGEVFHRLCHCWLQDFTPIAFLNLMQHPLVQLDVEKDQWQKWLYDLNRHILRGPKPATGWQALKARLKQNKEPLNAKIIQELDALWSNYAPSLSGDQWFACLEQTLRGLCQTDIWVKEGGEAICQIIEDLRKFVTSSSSKDQVQMLLEQTIRQKPWPENQQKGVPTVKGRIDLLTPSQARLLDYPIWILAGCQEGVWPKLTERSFWLNQAMRTYCGLPDKEWAIGHAAHDFCWPLWHGKKVFITTHQQSDDTYCQASRWVKRLEFVLAQYGWLDDVHQDLSRVIQKQPIKETQPPAPTPPISARPTTFSISDIDRWRRNPYRFYAEKILRLKPLEPLESDPDRADYGQKLHQILEQFVRTYPKDLPENAEAILLDIGKKALHDFADNPSLWQLWWPRFCQIARWFVQHEATYRQSTQVVGVEVPDQMIVKIDHLSLTLKGVIDRIDQDTEGAYHIIDYKTGTIPTAKDMVLGMAPQLPLEACLVVDTAKEHQHQPIYLDYWQLRGTHEGGQIHSMSDQGTVLAQQALDGLKTMIKVFSQPQTPYLAHPFSDWLPYTSPYDHLARVDAWWWQVQDGDEI